MFPRENAKKITNSTNKLSLEDERLMETNIFSIGLSGPQRTSSNSNSIDSQKDTTVSNHSHQLSDHEVSDHKVSDHEVSDHKVSDHKVSDHEVSDEEAFDDQDCEQDDLSDSPFDVYGMDCGTEDEEEAKAREEREKEIDEIIAASKERIAEMKDQRLEIKELRKEVQDYIEFENFEKEQSVLCYFAYQTEKMLSFYLYKEPKPVEFSKLIEISKKTPKSLPICFDDQKKLEETVEAIETLKKRSFTSLTIHYLQNLETKDSSELQTILSIAKKNNNDDIRNYTSTLVNFWEKFAKGNKIFDDESWKLSSHLST